MKHQVLKHVRHLQMQRCLVQPDPVPEAFEHHSAVRFRHVMDALSVVSHLPIKPSSGYGSLC